MKGPIAFVYGNCVFAGGPDDCWAAFALESSTYVWLSDEAKRARLLALVGALEALEADLQLLRISREPPGTRCAAVLDRGAAGSEEAGSRQSGSGQSDSGEAGTHAGRRGHYLERQRERLARIGASSAAVFALVSLREPERDVASYLSKAAAQGPPSWWRSLGHAFSARDGRLLRTAELERARVRADRAHARLEDYLPARPVRGVELQWLVRRAFCRGLGEPQLDALHEPRALAFERNGEALLAPLEADVMRWGSLVPFSTNMVMSPWFISRPHFPLGCPGTLRFEPHSGPRIAPPRGF